MTTTTNDWAETESSASFNNKVLPTGDYFSRIRGIAHMGMVHFSFQGAVNAKADAALGLVYETWEIVLNEDTEEYEVVSEEPVITYGVIKMNGSPKSGWTKTKNALKISSPPELVGKPVNLPIYTSRKDGKDMYMYPKADKMIALGLAERKAVPALVGAEFAIPSLDKMTKEVLLELNMFTQVKDYVLEATNYDGSKAEELVEEIRLENPDFAIAKAKEAKKQAPVVEELDDEAEY